MTSDRLFDSKVNHFSREIGDPEQWLFGERTAKQFNYVCHFHISTERMYKLNSIDRSTDYSPGKKQCEAFLADAVEFTGRQDSWINIGTFEPFMPVSFVINDTTVDVILP